MKITNKLNILIPLFLLVNCGEPNNDSDVEYQKDITDDFYQFVQEVWEDHNYNNSKFAVKIAEFKGGWVEYTGEITGFSSNGTVYFDVFNKTNDAYSYGGTTFDNITFWFETGNPKNVMDLKKGQIITIRGKFYRNESYMISGYSYLFYFKDVEIIEDKKKNISNDNTKKYSVKDIDSDEKKIVYAHNLLSLIDSVWVEHLWEFKGISVLSVFDKYEGQWIEYTGTIAQVGPGNNVHFVIHQQKNSDYDYPDSFMLFFEFGKDGLTNGLEEGQKIKVMGKLNLIDWWLMDEGCGYCCSFMFTEAIVLK